MSNRHVITAVAGCIRCSALRKYEDIRRGHVFGLLFTHLFESSSDKALDQSTLIFQEIDLCARCDRCLPLVFIHREGGLENVEAKRIFEKAKKIAEDDARQIRTEYVQTQLQQRRRRIIGVEVDRVLRLVQR